eukprot:3017392-Rhodomonas_salina.1
MKRREVGRGRKEREERRERMRNLRERETVEGRDRIGGTRLAKAEARSAGAAGLVPPISTASLLSHCPSTTNSYSVSQRTYGSIACPTLT